MTSIPRLRTACRQSASPVTRYCPQHVGFACAKKRRKNCDRNRRLKFGGFYELFGKNAKRESFLPVGMVEIVNGWVQPSSPQDARHVPTLPSTAIARAPEKTESPPACSATTPEHGWRTSRKSSGKSSPSKYITDNPKRPLTVRLRTCAFCIRHSSTYEDMLSVQHVLSVP